MRPLKELFEIVRRDGRVGPAVGEAELAVVTSKLTLPDGLVQLYRTLGNGVEFQEEEFYFCRLDQLVRPSFLPDGIGESWIDICDVGDGNSVAIDTETVDGDSCVVIDVFHETAGLPGNNKIIAQSFTEFLQRFLAGRDQYWLDSDCAGYGDALDPDT